MQIIPGNAQHQGSRKEQQDDFGFTDLNDAAFVAHAGVLALITDGMGGLTLGREASLTAKRTMLREYEKKLPSESISAGLERALQSANAAVVELARLNGKEGEAGTTLAAVVVHDRDLHWVSVGDSRIYLWQQGTLTQLSKDHNLANYLSQQVLNNHMTLEDAEDHPDRNALVSYLGLQELTEVHKSKEPLFLGIGDRILLCSDGLYNTISGQEISRILAQNAQKAANELIEAVLTKGKNNQDNFTVAILACDPDSIVPQDSPAKITKFPPKLIAIIISVLLIFVLSFFLIYNYFK